ncbi:MAG: YkgJ family cysteine cluster protein [Candidatus Hermodarchaeota archaeon]
MSDNKKNSSELRFACTRCGNCCTDKSTLVNVTFSDILRIKNGLNLNIDETLQILGFYYFENVPSKNELKKLMVPPIETEKGLAFVGLLKNNNSVCYFYDNKKKACSIYRLRPNFCRTFPFSFRIFFDKNDKTRAKIEMYYTEKGKQYCPGISSKAPIIKTNDWVKVGKETIEDLNYNNILVEKWNGMVKKGSIEPTVKRFLQVVFNLKKKTNKS